MRREHVDDEFTKFDIKPGQKLKHVGKHVSGISSSINQRKHTFFVKIILTAFVSLQNFMFKIFQNFFLEKY